MTPEKLKDLIWQKIFGFNKYLGWGLLTLFIVFGLVLFACQFTDACILYRVENNNIQSENTALSDVVWMEYELNQGEIEIGKELVSQLFDLKYRLIQHSAVQSRNCFVKRKHCPAYLLKLKKKVNVIQQPEYQDGFTVQVSLDIKVISGASGEVRLLEKFIAEKFGWDKIKAEQSAIQFILEKISTKKMEI